MLKVYLLVSLLSANGSFPAPDITKAPSFTSYQACWDARMKVYADAVKRKQSMVAVCRYASEV